MEKGSKTLRKLAVVIIVITTFASVAYAQQGNPLWKPIGQDTVSTNRVVKINESLKVKEKTTTSIMEVENYLKVGDSALWFVTSFGVDHIRSDVGKISLMEGTNTTFSSNIKVGIGTTTPAGILDVQGGTATAGNGNNINIFAQNGAPFNTNGGDIILMPGLANGAGIDGGVAIGLTSPNCLFQVKDLINFGGGINTFLGFQSGINNTTGTYNTAIGSFSLYSNNAGYANTATGHQALYSNTNGINNTANGEQALYKNMGGSMNTATGMNALHENSGSWCNTANGYEALYYNRGNNNTANGYEALYNNSTGYENTAVGYLALDNNSGGAGSNNIFIVSHAG